MGDGFGRVTHHNKYYISDGSISFLTGNTLFKVHRSFFERESQFFRNHFATTAEDDPLEGTEVRPFTLDVTADEFSQLLWVCYDGPYCYRQQTKANWVVILRLATRWSFPRIKDLALQELDFQGLSPAERISIYTAHGIEDDDRLLDSYVELCKSPVVPTAADGHLLQMETLINVLQAREDAQRRAVELGHESPTSASLGDETLREIVSRFFKKGLDPRSDGTSGSTGSGFQASRLNENGELNQKNGRSATITIGAPQVPERKAPLTGGPSHHANSSRPIDDKGQGNQAQNNNPLAGEGENKMKATNATQDKEREEKRKKAEREAKERTERERLEKEKEEGEKREQERQAKEKEERERKEREKERAARQEKEKEAREKAAQKAEEQKTPQTPQGRRTRGY